MGSPLRQPQSRRRLSLKMSLAALLSPTRLRFCRRLFRRPLLTQTSCLTSSPPQRTWRRGQPESQLAISQLLRSFRLILPPFRPCCFQQASFPLSSPRLLNCRLPSRPLPSTHSIFAHALALSSRLKPLRSHAHSLSRSFRDNSTDDLKER